MKKNLDLCGLGNSLVDIQIKSSEIDLARFKLNKGEMKQSDYKEQQGILKYLNDRFINKASGGSAANTIIAFTKFGGSASYLSLLGDDEMGYFYANEFKELGIELYADHISTEKTGICLILITPDGERTMCTALGATGLYTPEMINSDAIKSSEWLYIEGYKFSSGNSTLAVKKAVEIAKSSDTKISLTFSDSFITRLAPEALLEVTKQSDLVFCNENEALSFSNTTSVEDAMKYICSYSKNAVITLGSKGALVRWENMDYTIPSYPANPIDSTGAGDMFAAGFLYGIIKHYDPLIAGHLGAYAASLIVSHMGPRLNSNFGSIKSFVSAKLNKHL